MPEAKQTNLTHEEIAIQFAVLIDKTPIWKPNMDDILLLVNDHPDTVADAFEAWSKRGCNVAHKYNSIDDWSIYTRNHYQKVEDEKELEVYIRQFLRVCKFKTKVKQEDGSFKEYNASADKKHKTTSYITSVVKWLRDAEGIHLRPGQASPCSLSGKLDPKKIIGMGNGLLDISDPNNPVLHPFTEDFYTFNYLPFDYDPKATCPTWIDALGQYFKDENGLPDGLIPDILHSWIKKWLLRDTSHQKIFALIGMKRSGKGTIGRTISKLIGGSNVTPLTMTQLTKNFGLQPLLNKWLAVMWDASVGGRNANTAAAVEILKCISGEDTFTVDRKNTTQLSNIKFDLSVFMIANKLVDLRDSTGALAGRFTFLETTGSFYGNEDPKIEDRLEAELPGILNMVIKAPEGRVMEHPKSRSLQQDFEELSSPYIAFINEWCDLDSDFAVPADVLWAYYIEWAKQNNHHEPSPQKFKIDFNGSHEAIKKNFRPNLNELQFREMKEEYYLDQRPGPSIRLSTRPRCYKGINIKEELKGVWAGRESPF